MTYRITHTFLRSLTVISILASFFLSGIAVVNAQPSTLPLPTGPPGGGVDGAGDGGGIDGGGPCGASFCNPLAFNTLEDFLRAILSALIMIAFPILVLFMVYAGFKFVAAQGKPEEIAKARKIFLWTLVGALIVLGAQAISLAVQATIESLQAP